MLWRPEAEVDLETVGVVGDVADPLSASRRVRRDGIPVRDQDLTEVVLPFRVLVHRSNIVDDGDNVVVGVGIDKCARNDSCACHDEGADVLVTSSPSGESVNRDVGGVHSLGVSSLSSWPSGQASDGCGTGPVPHDSVESALVAGSAMAWRSCAAHPPPYLAELT
jgi:hypothetical protein